MSRGRFLVVLLLGLMLLASAIGVVYAKYASRKQFVELQKIQKERDVLEVEWGRLQLELSTQATHERIARDARNKLNMHSPSAAEVVVRP